MLPKTRTSKRKQCRQLLTLHGQLLGRVELLVGMMTLDPATFTGTKQLATLGMHAARIGKFIDANFKSEREVCLAMDMYHYHAGWTCAHYF